MTDTTTDVRRWLASAMIAAPLFLLAGTAVLPAAIGDRHGTDRARSLHVLQAVAPDRSRLPVGLILIIIGLALLVPAAFGLAWHARGSRLALVGAAMVTVGAPMGAASNAVSTLTAYRLTDPRLSPDSAVDAFAGTIGPAGAIMFLLYLLVLLGLILLAVAAWRGRSLTWWQAGLIGAGGLVGFAAGEGAVGALSTLPLCLGLLIAARRSTTAVEVSAGR